jgi:hypothetical protein
MSRRTATRPEVRVGGFWLSSIVPQGWGELKHSTRLTGSWQASWAIPNTKTWRHPALVYGARVDIMLGPVVIWSGTLEEPDWDAGEFIALGACRDGETAMALDGSGNSSTVPNTVIDAAITRGVLSWTRVGDFGTTAVGDSTAGLVTIQSVLDAWAQKNNSRWVVNEQRQLIIVPVDETTPKWFIVPGSGVLGSTSQERADRVFVRYIDSTTGSRATASYPAATPAGGDERPKDLTDRGAMTSTQAVAEATAIWNELAGRNGFTNGWTLTSGQVTTTGGTTADGALVKAGDTVAALGLPDARGISHNTLVVLGDTDYDWEDDELSANPSGLAARDTDSVLEQVGNLAVDAMAAATNDHDGDAGWIALTSSIPGTIFAAYRVRGKECSVRLRATSVSFNAATDYAVVAAGGIPSAARPGDSGSWSGAVVGGVAGAIAVATDGSVIVRQDTGATRTGALGALFTYPIG